MRHLLILGVLAVLGIYILVNFRVDGLDGLSFIRRDTDSSASDDNVSVKRSGKTVRIASFHINVLGSGKLDKTHVSDLIARLIRRFDIVAIQGIRSRDDDVLPRLVEATNATGANFDFVVGPRLPISSRDSSPGKTFQEQYAFIFDRASVEVDRAQLYTIDDPDDLIRREPLIAWFRVRGPPEDQAFTFSLVNLHLDGNFLPEEMDALRGVFKAVQGDGRDEDDVILLGDFEASERDFGSLRDLPGVDWVIAGTPTDIMASQQRSNVVFSKLATVEYEGRGGVLDFLREFNLSEGEAREISDHMPVWAEFSIFEGGKPGQVAAQPESRR
ncbi:MAG TPA: endonuclease/exonuclease/phosphatase [Planctomycetes bacterium]|nr:endonuclease/exonuclease/phosphatase [Planctomycetaceae bacterium]HIM29809.1 endonuclease/exonuclease/phosphatase [Planctomycetota bacterium]